MLALDMLESLRSCDEASLKELAALDVVEAQNPRLTFVPVVMSRYSEAAVCPPEPELWELATLFALEC
jgi:ribosome biogenesis protein Tsr3